MPTKKKEELVNKNSLNYYGTQFEYKFIKSLIENPEDFNEISSYLHPSDVSDPGLQEMVRQMLAFNDKKGRPATWRELEYLIKDKVDTEEKLHQVKDAYAQTKDIDCDALDDVSEIGIKFLKKQEMRRILLSAADKIEKNGYTPETLGDTIDNLRTVERKTKALYTTPYTLYDLVMSETIDKRITTGIPQLDEKMNGGLPKGTLGLLIAGTGVGKTTMMTHMATMITASGCKVLYLYFEDKDTDMIRKSYSVITGVQTKDFTNNNEEAKRALQMACKEHPNFARVCSKENNLRFLRLANGETTIEEIKSIVRTLEHRDGWKPDVIFLDYLSCIQSSSDKRLAIDKEFQTLDRAMKKLDAFVQEEDFAIWVAQQTNRSGAKEDTKSDRTANVQGSYRITQTASVILYLEKLRDSTDYNRANIYLDKCRGGELGEWRDVYFNNGTCQIDLGETMTAFNPDKAFANDIITDKVFTYENRDNFNGQDF